MVNSEPASTHSSVVACQLTPPGRGAIATVVVAGAGAVDMVDRVFNAAAGRPLTAFPADRIVFGQWGSAANTAEAQPSAEELVTHVDTSGSVYVHCHGGDAAVQAVLDSMVQAGATQIAWQHWLKTRAAQPLQAECEIALSQARTTRTAGILLDQHRGALHRALSVCAAGIAAGRISNAITAIDELLQWRVAGLHLTQPFRVVLSGAPNAGKSSLMNAMLGYQRAIVFDQPGTTRDALTAQTAIDGWPVELCDTAGIRQSHDDLEQQGVARALQRAAGADLILRVQPAGGAATSMPIATSQAAQLEVISKADLLTTDLASVAENAITTSAVTGSGIAELLAAVIPSLLPQQPPPGVAVPFLPAHFNSLTETRQALEDENTAAAALALQSFYQGPLDSTRDTR